MSYTRRDFSVGVYQRLGNLTPHPWMIKYLVAWTQVETEGLGKPNALNNLLNTTEPGFGSDLFPEWNSVHVRQYPTFEDGVSATVASLIGEVEHFYPNLLEALRTNNGVSLGSQGHPSDEIVGELNTWSGNANYAANIAELANSNELRLDEVFPGRHAGQRE